MRGNRAVGVALCALAVMAAGTALAAGTEPGSDKDRAPHTRTLTVTATAYNALVEQTDDTPHVGAWGDHLDRAVKPGTRVIAVSPDLLAAGLRRGQRVRIQGLKGEFVVLDKMPRRWQKRIDIYMHKDVRGARKWGKRKVKITWAD